jgi:hypothetical protein
MTQMGLFKLGKDIPYATGLRMAIGLLALTALPNQPLSAQLTTHNVITPADSFRLGRFWLVTGTTAAAYTGTIIALNEVWYKDYPRGSFHFFNDWGEWENMDKMGHWITAYFESDWYYALAKWTGIPDRKAQWVGAGMGILLQSTVEVMDGFSENWGFSVPDFTFNALGAATFFAQQRIWGEQRIRLKLSATTQSYPTYTILSEDGEHTTTLRHRANELYGTGFFERLLKDYNAQTAWVSVNIASFIRAEESRFPAWLNIAIGYGANNMYGGFSNKWEEAGADYTLDAREYPRTRQYYLSPDIDLSRIPSRSPLVRTLLALANVIKIPAPTLELNSEGKLRMHILHF